jgi:predicted enzyme related to lactoylglutathione lyase
MPERTSYAPGTPCWVDLGAADLDAAVAFYSDLFGWEVPERPDSAEMGGYRRALKGGADVAGLYPQMEAGMPSVWMTYVAVSDAEATAAAVKEAGGQVVAEPMALPHGIGKLAVFLDSTGAAFGVWEPGEFPGAKLVNEPGALSWNELGTRDVEASKAFYDAVFGWSTDEHDMGDMGTYVEWKLGDASIGGMMDITGRVPDEVPNHWLVYFAVESTDATVEQVKAGGGDLAFGPIDIPAGRFAIVNDPGGTVFAVIQMPEQAAA